MGLAMGCIGMSMDDFSRCTPIEFAAIYRMWQQHDEQRLQYTWEQTRFLACCTLQPHSKKKLLPTDICRFSWEKRKEKAEMAERSTKERFEEMAEKWK